MKSVIIGAGTYGEVYLAYLREAGINVVGFLDDDIKYKNTCVKDVPVLGPVTLLETLKQTAGVEAVYCPLGNNKLRVKFLSYANKLGYETPNYIHPSVIISPEVKIGKGVYILLGTTIMPYTEIKDYVMISMNVSLAHHNILEEGVFLSTGCNFGASIHAHKYAYCGIGSTIMTGLHELGEDCLIGAGAVVIKDVPDNAVVAGVPAKVLKIKDLSQSWGGKIAIFGAGGFGRHILELLEYLHSLTGEYKFIGFFDDGLKKGTMVNGYPILGGRKELNEWGQDLSLVVAIGSAQLKKQIITSITNSRINYPTIIHPNVVCGNNNVHIGKGCIICSGTTIVTNVNIGDFTILNMDCTVGHDVNIGNYSSFMPSVNVSGEVNIGEAFYAGTNSTIINQLNIGSDVTIGAGAVVVKDLPNKALAVGVPAKIIKYKDK